MKKVLPGSLLLFSLLVTTFAQNPSPTPVAVFQKEKAPQEEVVRITTNLVQVDVSVIDKNGKAVTDIKPEEFEIKEDDHVQKITNFSYISSEPSEPASSPGAAVDKNTPPAVAPASLRPSQVKRTMALVVDDIGLSFESTEPVRNALRKFVDSQMQPGDLVAIIRTAGGMGVLQQFTSDKGQLYATINSIRWSPNGRTGATSAETMGGRYDSTDEIKELSEFRNEILSVGTLAPLLYVIRGLKDLPGRKSIVFFSENLRVTSAIGRNDRLLNAMQRVTDEANRASVVLYTQDASGLQPLNYTAADSSMPGSNDISAISLGGGLAGNHDTAEANLARLRALGERRNVEYETHTVLDYLAQQTGGTFTRFSNDLNAAIRSAVEDQKSYYLIGYRPDELTFDPATGARRFHKWEIKVKRTGLKVRYRNGFYGVPDDNKQEISVTPQAQLTKALISPFVAGDVHVRLTSLFRGDASTGSYVNSLIHIDARDLTFKEAADGWREAAIDVIAMTFGDNGSVVDQVARTQTIRVRDDTYKRFLQNGLAYNLTVPVKKAGAYQMRVAVRDVTTSRLGSASQFIEVPDLSKDRLSLSSIVISGSDPNAKAAQTTPAGVPGEDQFEQQIVSALRRLRYGMFLDYGYVIYNAQLDRIKNQPQIQTQIRLLRDGQEIFAGRLSPFDPTGQTDPKQLIAGGRLQVGTAMLPGQYILQVVVTDQLAKEKFRTATQWIDFEVVK
jgi:VWFA-related protein